METILGRIEGFIKLYFSLAFSLSQLRFQYCEDKRGKKEHGLRNLSIDLKNLFLESETLNSASLWQDTSDNYSSVMKVSDFCL